MKTIFVSSTFNDMQYERDAIREISMPIINSHAEKYGESVSFCDLRWGVNTTDLESDTGSKKVLDVCLNEIDRCRPYMVVILGDRYGWIPDSTVVGSVAAQKKFDLQDLEMSVTALEIEYGSLSSGADLSHTLFYFRDFEGVVPDEYTAEDLRHKQKLDELKARISRLSGGTVKHYTVSWDGKKLRGVEEFAKGLAIDITKLLETEWVDTASTSDFVKDQSIHQSFAAENSALLCIRAELVTQILNDIDSNRRLVVVNGGSGSGKSVLLSRLYQETKSKYDVLFYACGLTSMCTCTSDVIDGIVGTIERSLGKEPHSIATEQDPGRYRDYIFELYEAYEESGRHLVLILDGLEKLLPTKERDTLKFLPSPYGLGNMSCVIGSDGIRIPLMRPHQKDEWDGDWSASRIYDLHDHINDSEKRAVLKSILSAQKKELDEKVINHIIDTKRIDSLFELQLIINGLLAMNKEDFLRIKKYGNDMEAINRYQMELIDGYPDSDEALSCLLLNKFAKGMGLSFMSEALKILAVSKFGLTDEDLKQLVPGYNTLDFVHFTTYMKDFFIQRFDGRYDYSHQCARRGILKTISNIHEYSQKIIAVLSTRDDEIQLQEIVYHYLSIGDMQGFAQYIIKWESRSYSRDTMTKRAAERARFFAARALFDHCVRCGMTGLINLVKEPDLWERNQSFIYFLNLSFNSYLRDNEEEEFFNQRIELYRTIVVAIDDLSYEDFEEETQRKRNYIEATWLWAKATLERGREEDTKTALKVLKIYIRLNEWMAKVHDPVYDYLHLSGCYFDVAYLCEKIDSADAREYVLELYKKKYDLESSEQYKQEYRKKVRTEPDSPSMYALLNYYEKVGNPQAYERAIELINNEILSLSKGRHAPDLDGELGELVEENRKYMERYNCHSRASMYDRIMGLVEKQNGVDKADRIMEYCEKIAAEMDVFLKLNYEPAELLSIYYESYRMAIKRLMDVNTEKSNRLALDYCKKVTSKISGVKALGNINQTILEICEFAGEIYSKLGEHEDAISCYEVAERIHRINLRESQNPENEWNLSYCCSKLAKEHLTIPETEHLEKAMVYCTEHVGISTSLYEKSRTIEDFNLLVHARGSLASVLSKTGGLDAERKMLQYRMETAKLINESQVPQSDLQRLLQILWWEYSYIVQACVEKENALSLDEQIELFENYVAALKRIVAEAPEKIQSWGINKQLKKTYMRLSDTYLDKGDFYESKKYADLASEVIE